MIKTLTILFFLLFSFQSFGQLTIIKGKVKNYATEESLPFVNIYFKGTVLGTTTDIDGRFSLKTREKYDTIAISFVGYKTKFLPIKVGVTQTLNIDLELATKLLEAIEIKYDKKNKYKNPAWDIIRGFLGHRKQNDKYNLKAYEFDNYTHIQIYAAEISKALSNTKLISKMLAITQSFDTIKDSSGRVLLPLFFSESSGKVYYRSNPARLSERIEKTNFKGIFIREQGGISFFLGNTYQEYDFYRNTVSIFQKQFISPLSANWRLYYDYILENENDTIDGIPCYRIRYSPKQIRNLTFKGKLWISKNNFALKKIEAETQGKININFIEKVIVSINYQPVRFNLQSDKYAWLPKVTQVEVKVGEILEKVGKLSVKYDITNSKFNIDRPYPLIFYQNAIEVADNAAKNDENYWLSKRPITDDTVKVPPLKAIIDSLDNTKSIKNLKTHVIALNTGYYSFNKIDLGPYPNLYTFNNIEGHRVYFGGKTNGKLTNKFTFSGYVAYGTKDERFKYKVNLRFIPTLKPWLVFNISHQKDIEQISLFIDRFNTGVLFNSFDNTGFSPSAFFYPLSRFGTLRRPFFHKITQVWGQMAVSRGFFQTISIRQRKIIPLFPFEYITNDNAISSQVDVTELILETRLSFKENWVFNRLQNAYSSLGTRKPIFLLRYTRTLNILDNNTSYEKVDFTFRHSTLINIGRLTYQINLGYYFKPVPYLLIESHLGNTSPVFNSTSFNLLKIFEYSSDRYITLLLRNNFDGLIFNHIPLLRRLKWRSIIGLRAIYGVISQATQDVVLSQTRDGETIPPIFGLGELPYIETNFGIHNIFKIIRVDFIFRLTYRDTNTANFAIKFVSRLTL